MQKLYKLSKYYLDIISFTVDTNKDIKILKKIFKNYSVKKVLDIACGVGRHCIPLTKLNYNVTGIDKSSSQLHQANILAKRENVQPVFIQADVNIYVPKLNFDAAICMWSSLGEEPMLYKNVISNVFNSLNRNGIFIIDTKTWYNISKQRQKHTQSHFIAHGNTYKIHIYDRFTEHFRVRESTYDINGKKYSDLCITHLLQPVQWKRELKQAGFRNCQFDYQYNIHSNKPNRVFITAAK